MRGLQQKHLAANNEALNKQSEKNSLKMTIASLKEQIEAAESGVMHDLELENLLSEKEKVPQVLSSLKASAANYMNLSRNKMIQGSLPSGPVSRTSRPASMSLSKSSPMLQRASK